MNILESATSASQQPVRVVDRKHWVLAKLCFSIVLALTTWFSAAAVMPQLKEHWHVTQSEATWLAMAVQIGFVVGAVVSAVTSLSDLVAPRRLMAIASLMVAVTNLALLIVPTPTLAIILRILTGMFLAGVYPPAMKFVSTWFKEGRGTALGFVIGALTLGSAMPHAINALGGAGWRLVIVVTSAATLLAAALFMFALEDGPFPFPKVTFRPSEVASALTDKSFLLCTAGYLGHMWELYAMWSWLLFFVTDRLQAIGHPNPVWASVTTFMIIAAGTPACIIAGWVADRIGRPYTTILLMSMSGLCALSIGFVFEGREWLFLTIGLVWGATIIADSAQFSAIVTESGKKFVGSALTIQMGAGFAITILAILVLPSVSLWLNGWRWAFLVLVPGPLLGSVAMAALARRQAS